MDADVCVSNMDVKIKVEDESGFTLYSGANQVSQEQVSNNVVSEGDKQGLNIKREPEDVSYQPALEYDNYYASNFSYGVNVGSVSESEEFMSTFDSRPSFVPQPGDGQKIDPNIKLKSKHPSEQECISYDMNHKSTCPEIFLPKVEIKSEYNHDNIDHVESRNQSDTMHVGTHTKQACNSSDTTPRQVESHSKQDCRNYSQFVLDTECNIKQEEWCSSDDESQLECLRKEQNRIPKSHKSEGSQQSESGSQQSESDSQQSESDSQQSESGSEYRSLRRKPTADNATDYKPTAILIDGEFLCPEEGCQRTFKAKPSLYSHVLSVHTKRRFKCTEPNCGKVFKLLGHLKRHKLSVHQFYLTPGEFICSVEGCGKAFQTKDRLYQHNRYVHSERNYKCLEPGCDKVFKTPKHLKCHRAVHITVRDFECSEIGCGKKFKTKHELYTHGVTVHNGRRFKCPDCGKMFQTASALTKHLAVHKTERDYVCQEEGCDKNFKTNHSLSRHKKLVHGERAFKCPEPNCGKMFQTKSNLNTHLSIHVPERDRLICPDPDCSKIFKTKNGLIYHLSMPHTEHISSKQTTSNSNIQHSQDNEDSKSILDVIKNDLFKQVQKS